MMAHVTRKIHCGGKPMTVVVLAGGRSRRMKADKAMLDVGGRTLLEHVLVQVEPLFDEVLVSRSPGQRLSFKGRAAAQKASSVRSPRSAGSSAIAVVEDEIPGRGPMAGILAGLRAARNDACMAIACDIPDIDAPFLRRLARAAANSEIVVPVNAAGQFEPLFAVYTRGVIPKIEALLGSGKRSVLPLFQECRTVTVPLGNAFWLLNLNTRADYRDYLARRRAIRGPIRGRTKSSR